MLKSFFRGFKLPLLTLALLFSNSASAWTTTPLKLPLSLGDDAADVYFLQDEKKLSFEWNAQQYEWQIFSYAVKDELGSHGASGALHVVLTQVQDDKKIEIAATRKAILCGSFGRCEIDKVELETAGDQMPMLNVEAGAYSGQGHTFGTSFLLQAQGGAVEAALCWFADREGECGENEYKWQVEPKMILNENVLQAFELKTNGTRCADTKLVEKQNLIVQIPFDKNKFKIDPTWIGNLTCYASTQNQ